METMSVTPKKEAELQCMCIGSGDYSTGTINGERRALPVTKFTTKIPTSSSLCRRIAYEHGRTKGTDVYSSPRASKLTPSNNELRTCKKAASVSDLSTTPEVKPKRRRPIHMPLSELNFGTCTVTTEDESSKDDVTMAARRVFQSLILNAWRRKRLEVVTLTSDCQKLEFKVQDMDRQIFVLRSLLESEKDRVEQVNAEIQQKTSLVEELHRETDSLKEEKEGLEEKVQTLEDSVLDGQTKCGNLKNDFFQARAEIASLEAQMCRERSKVSKLREDKKILLEKIQTIEEMVASKNMIIDGFQFVNKDLEDKLASEVEKNAAAERESKKDKDAIKSLEEEHATLSKELAAVVDDCYELEEKLKALEKSLSGKDSENRELLKTIQELRNENLELERKILQQTRMQISWRSRILQIAAGFARLPLSLYYNVAIWLQPQNEH